MSYEIVKSISKKKDKIFITSASNNVSPKTYSKWEFMPDSLHNKEKVSNKKLYLFHGIIGGSYKLNKSVNENWIYAENKFYEYCRENNISTSYIWELPYLNDGDIKTLKPYYEIFKKYYEEKIDGKYYLSSSLGQIIKVNETNFKYVPFISNISKECKSYKKAYNDYCNISEQSREKYNIEVKEYTLDNNKNIINTKNNDSMEL